MNLQGELIELWHLKQGELDSIQRIRQYIQSQCEAHRKYSFGEIVSVYDIDNKHICDGVVGEVRSSIFMELLDIKAYALQIKDVNTYLSKLRYEIFALKKNGKPSENHLFRHQHMIYDRNDVKAKDFDYFIDKQKTNT